MKKEEAQSTSQVLEIIELPHALSDSESTLPVQFVLPQRAFNTASQIFNNDWEINPSRY
ncbi:hypothetical protein Aasi_0145 [Candidatus Amoebophilus asiaticus 5a2]|uniref:Uncharacterized protein n=1 Tax=Amoebophilus asiaticus (strain 5a2) TaxID=452471 RepID=B3EUH2_AMOA5|nr:hypothetical protein Aasi_0145 [Candidatus Amoebophilus asiaticus 5a2]